MAVARQRILLSAFNYRTIFSLKKRKVNPSLLYPYGEQKFGCEICKVFQMED